MISANPNRGGPCNSHTCDEGRVIHSGSLLIRIKRESSASTGRQTGSDNFEMRLTHRARATGALFYAGRISAPTGHDSDCHADVLVHLQGARANRRGNELRSACPALSRPFSFGAGSGSTVSRAPGQSRRSRDPLDALWSRDGGRLPTRWRPSTAQARCPGH